MKYLMYLKVCYEKMLMINYLLKFGVISDIIWRFLIKICFDKEYDGL